MAAPIGQTAGHGKFAREHLANYLGSWALAYCVQRAGGTVNTAAGEAMLAEQIEKVKFATFRPVKTEK